MADKIATRQAYGEALVELGKEFDNLDTEDITDDKLNTEDITD